jgi:hypothetical protein
MGTARFALKMGRKRSVGRIVIGEGTTPWATDSVYQNSLTEHRRQQDGGTMW